MGSGRFKQRLTVQAGCGLSHSSLRVAGVTGMCRRTYFYSKVHISGLRTRRTIQCYLGLYHLLNSTFKNQKFWNSLAYSLSPKSPG